MNGQEALEQVNLFRKLSEQIRSDIDPDSVAAALFEVIRNLVDTDRLGLFVFTDYPVGIVPVGPGSLAMLDHVITLREEGVVDWVFDREDLVFAPIPDAFGLKESGRSNLLLLPLKVGDEKVGLLFAVLKQEPNSIREFTRTLIFLVVSQAAVAIKHAREYIEAANAKNYLSRILETVSDVVYSTDKAGIITFTNSRVGIFGFKPEHLVGKPIYTLIPIEKDKGRTVKVLSEGKTFDYEVEFELPGEKKIWFAVNQAPLRDPQNEITGSLGILRDITARRMLEEESLRRKRFEALTEAAISINHEFNNPLTVIQGDIYILEHLLPMDEYPKVRKTIQTLKAHADRIAEVVKKFNKIHEMSSVEYPGGLKMLNIHDTSVDKKMSDSEG